VNYGIEHEGKVYGPDGLIETVANVDAHNHEQEQAEIAWLKTGPEKVFLYVEMPTPSEYERANKITPLSGAVITTWLGTVVSDKPSCVGSYSYFREFYGTRSKRRPVDCRIFGVRYVGWYFESSGNYCRLRKAKHQ
jgi:hypothetical protein